MFRILLFILSLALAIAWLGMKHKAHSAEGISPQKLYLEAKKHCSTNDRACIAEWKGKIIVQVNPRIAQLCAKYRNTSEYDQCVDWYYMKGDVGATYSSLRYKMWIDDSWAGTGCVGGPFPGERQDNPDTTPEHTPGGVTGGRSTTHTNPRNDPRSNQSTVTGPIRPDDLRGGGTAPPQKVQKPTWMGGGSAAPSGTGIKGIALPTESQERKGHLDIDAGDLTEKSK